MCVLRFGLLKARDEDMYEWLLQYIDHNQVRILNMIMGGGVEESAKIEAFVKLAENLSKICMKC